MKKHLLTLALAGALPLASFAFEWKVNNANTSGTYDGLTWQTAFQDIHEAIAASSAGDEIWVAMGNAPYVPTLLNGSVPVPPDEEWPRYKLKSGVGLYGGFQGGETQRDQRNWNENITIISGDRGVINDPSDNVNSVVVASGTLSGTVIDGFVIEDGDGSPGGINWTYTGGAGMAVTNAEVQIWNITFRNNNAGIGAVKKGGGGLLVRAGSDVMVHNCRFENNQAEEGGGMCVADNAIVQVVNCLFFNNQANLGGGLTTWANQAGTEIVNCTFYGNSSGTAGGGAIMNISGSQPLLANSILDENPSLDTDNSDIANFVGSYYPQLSIYIYTTSPIVPSSITAVNSITQVWATGTNLMVGVDPDFKGTTLPEGPDQAFGTNDDHFIAKNGLVGNTGDNSLINATGMTRDVTGNPRIMYGTVDLGIYEFGTYIYPKLNVAAAVEAEELSELRVYPNPTEGQVVIESAEAITSVLVYDLVGNLVSQEVPGQQTQRLNLDMSAHPAGMYLVEINGHSSQNLQKLIVR